MTTISEGSLTFSFSDAHEAVKYDEWPFYRRCFQVIPHTKAMDIICVTSEAVWLIEIKDYRKHNRKKQGTIEEEVAQKVRDTLAGLAAASADGGGRGLANMALSRHRWRVVLHIERARKAMANTSTLQMKLQRYLKGVDANLLVTDAEHVPKTVPWTVRVDTTKT